MDPNVDVIHHDRVSENRLAVVQSFRHYGGRTIRGDGRWCVKARGLFYGKWKNNTVVDYTESSAGGAHGDGGCHGVYPEDATPKSTSTPRLRT